MKKDKTNLVIWAVVALVIGVVIGTFLVGPMTSGNAKRALASKNNKTVTKIFEVSNEFGKAEIHVIKEDNGGSTEPQLDQCCYFGQKTSYHTSGVDEDGDPWELFQCEGEVCTVDR